jgi:hypothetical protein
MTYWMNFLKVTLGQQRLGVFHHWQAPCTPEQLADWSQMERMIAEP